jgi:hypothetical protein
VSQDDDGHIDEQLERVQQANAGLNNSGEDQGKHEETSAHKKEYRNPALRSRVDAFHAGSIRSVDLRSSGEKARNITCVAIHMLRIKGDQGIPSTPPFALFLCVEGL